MFLFMLLSHILILEKMNKDHSENADLEIQEFQI